MRMWAIKCNVKKTICYRQIRNLYKTVKIIAYMCHSEDKHVFGETQLLYDIY